MYTFYKTSPSVLDCREIHTLHCRSSPSLLNSTASFPPKFLCAPLLRGYCTTASSFPNKHKGRAAEAGTFSLYIFVRSAHKHKLDSALYRTEPFDEMKRVYFLSLFAKHSPQSAHRDKDTHVILRAYSSSTLDGPRAQTHRTDNLFVVGSSSSSAKRGFKHRAQKNEHLFLRHVPPTFVTLPVCVCVCCVCVLRHQPSFFDGTHCGLAVREGGGGLSVRPCPPCLRSLPRRRRCWPLEQRPPD